MDRAEGPHVARFPVEELRVRNATLWALIFENMLAGVPLGLTWSMMIEFESVVFADRTLDCSLSADWIRLPGVRDWRRIDGVEVVGGLDVIEASFYTLGHDSVTRSKVRFDRTRGESFRVRWEAETDLPAWRLPELEATTVVSVDCEAVFEGVFVHPSLVEHVEDVSRAARELATPFTDLSVLGDVRIFHNQLGVPQVVLPPRAD